MLTEGEVIGAVCQHLKDQGYAIVGQCTTREKGIDITATRSGTRLLVEAKGETSSRPGSRRHGKAFTRSQHFDHIAKAFYTAASLAGGGEESGDESALALPDVDDVRDFLEKIRPALLRLEIRAFLVREDLSVAMFPVPWP